MKNIGTTIAIIVCAAFATAHIAMAAQEVKLPGTLGLDALTRYFAAVSFDHSQHVELLGDCTMCHHHTTGSANSDPNCGRCHNAGARSATVSCRGCHPVEPFSAEYLKAQSADTGRYHLDKPGLMAAYHRSCLGCHQESGGPTGCQDCHARTAAGDALYRTGSYTPQPSAAHAAEQH